jgi:hypothetical protein
LGGVVGRHAPALPTGLTAEYRAAPVRKCGVSTRLTFKPAPPGTLDSHVPRQSKRPRSPFPSVAPGRSCESERLAARAAAEAATTRQLH